MAKIELKNIIKDIIYSNGWYIKKRIGLPVGVDLYTDIERIVKKTEIKIIYDVGAHYGNLSASYAKMWKNADIFSFEPSNDSFIKLLLNSKKNPRIHPYNLALGNVKRLQNMFLKEYDQMNSLKSELNVGKSNTPFISVEIETLDEMVAKLGHTQIDLLKIDVEGFENEVLDGGANSFAGNIVRLVLIEASFALNDKYHTNLFQIQSKLSKYNYILYAIYDQAATAPDKYGYFNALFIKREMA